MASPFRHVGNLKLAVEPAPVDAIAATHDLKQAIGARPVWLAASTHPGEEEIVFATHKEVACGYHPGLLTIIVPRHPHAWRRDCGAGGKVKVCLSMRAPVYWALCHEAIDSAYLADTMGELGTLYNVAPIVFIGGSLTFDGHSPVEAAQRGAAIVYGPHDAQQRFDRARRWKSQGGFKTHCRCRTELIDIHEMRGWAILSGVGQRDGNCGRPNDDCR